MGISPEFHDDELHDFFIEHELTDEAFFTGLGAIFADELRDCGAMAVVLEHIPKRKEFDHPEAWTRVLGGTVVADESRQTKVVSLQIMRPPEEPTDSAAGIDSSPVLAVRFKGSSYDRIDKDKFTKKQIACILDIARCLETARNGLLPDLSDNWTEIRTPRYYS